MDPDLIELCRWIDKNKGQESRAVQIGRLPDNLRTVPLLQSALNNKLLLLGERKFCMTCKIDQDWLNSPHGPVRYEPAKPLPNTRAVLPPDISSVTEKPIPHPPWQQQVRFEDGPVGKDGKAKQIWVFKEPDPRWLDGGAERILDEDAAWPDWYPVDARAHVKLSAKGLEALREKAKPQLVGAK